MCKKNMTGIMHSDQEGPLRVDNSRIKCKIRYILNTNYFLERTDYTYDNSGLLKTKKRSYGDNIIYTVINYFYDKENRLHKEIIKEGILYSDTIHNRYNSNNNLIEKIRIHCTSNFILKDTVFYKYDADGNLIEWTRKDPYDQYQSTHGEKNEYLDGLLVKKYSYINEDLQRTFYYVYQNGIVAQELVYYKSNKLEYRADYYYKNRLLVKILEYYFGSDISESHIIFEYNTKYQ
jgi:hypothetical protein